MMRFALLILFGSLLLPQAAEAAPIAPGDRVLVKGRFQRKCAARVQSVPAPGFARLSFDRAGCGDGGQPYELSQLQKIIFSDEAKIDGGTLLRKGDTIVVKGFRSRACSGRVREVSRTGYVAVDYDALLCTDTEALRKVKELTRVTYVEELTFENKSFKVGQKVSVPGIVETEICAGVIRRLTDNGLAALDLKQLTCADRDHLWELNQLTIVASSARDRKVSAESIVRNVMRQIASDKKIARRSRF
jgi:hypothetical protein